MKRKIVLYFLVAMLSLLSLGGNSIQVFAAESDASQSVELPDIKSSVDDYRNSPEYQEAKKQLEEAAKEKVKELENKSPAEIKEDIDKKKTVLEIEAIDKVTQDTTDAIISRDERKKAVIESNNKLLDNVQKSRPRTLEAIANAEASTDEVKHEAKSEKLIDTSDINERVDDSLAKRIASYPDSTGKNQETVTPAQVSDEKEAITIDENEVPLAAEKSAIKVSFMMKLLIATVATIGFIAMLVSIYRKYKDEF